MNMLNTLWRSSRDEVGATASPTPARSILGGASPAQLRLTKLPTPVAPSPLAKMWPLAGSYRSPFQNIAQSTDSPWSARAVYGHRFLNGRSGVLASRYIK